MKTLLKLSFFAMVCSLSLTNTTSVYANSCSSEIYANFSADNTSVVASSDKELSNVVLILTDGSFIKFDNLDKNPTHEKEFFADSAIEKVCIKAGCEKSMQSFIKGLKNNGTGECIEAPVLPSCSAKTITIGNASSLEGQPIAPRTLNFSVSLSQAVESSDCEVAVDFNTGNSSVAPSASADDYTAQSSSLNFTSGELTKNITISITADLAEELNELMNVTLSNPTVNGVSDINTVITQATGVGTIVNDDIFF